MKKRLDSCALLYVYLGILEGMWFGSKRNYSSKEVGVKGVDED